MTGLSHLRAVGYDDIARANQLRDEIMNLGWNKHALTLAMSQWSCGTTTVHSRSTESLCQPGQTSSAPAWWDYSRASSLVPHSPARRSAPSSEAPAAPFQR